MRAPAEAMKVPKKPSKARGTRPAAALLDAGELVLAPVPDVLDDVVVVVVWPGAVGVAEVELPDGVAEAGVVVPVDSPPPHSSC